MDFVGIDKFSLLDYEDCISVVLFGPGCNFRCPFCHNGDSVLNSCQSIPFNEILEYIESRKNVLDAIVVSGGEPTLMPDLHEKLCKLREFGLKIKLDSNGTRPDLIKKFYDEKLIDYVAMDIKNSEDQYPVTAGVKSVAMDKIKESISLLISSGIDYEFRTTLVAEFHKKEDIEKMGQLVKGAKVLYLQKFVDREGVIQKGLHSVSEEEALEFKDILLKYVNKVELRGY